VNDSELMTALKESFTGVQSPTPVERIVSRGRAVRARRRAPALAAALAVAAGTAAAVTALLPSGHQPGLQLAAWTVSRQADGTVTVTIRQLHDPAGLQRRLRADGIPASVTFFGQPPRACQRFPVDPAMVNKVYQSKRAGRFPVMVIHPAALPAGAGVQINPQHQRHITAVAIGLVHTSPQCTG